jgi:nucleotide-binding universal stress UspA family protein
MPQQGHMQGQEGHMHIRTILAAVSGGTATPGVLDTACRLCRRFASHLEVLHIRGDTPDAVSLDAVRSAGHVGKVVLPDARETADAARLAFDWAVARHGLQVCDNSPTFIDRTPMHWDSSATWREETGFAPAAVARRGRLFDLVILGRSGRVLGEPCGTTIKDTVIAVGRPVLAASSTVLDKLGDSIAVAWNDTPEASRALAAATPLLTQANQTHVLCFGDMRMDDLVAQLAWYGVSATGHRFPALAHQRVATGDFLLSATRDVGADLLVMGAYGHAPWREFLLGGATQEVLRSSLVPVLLAH